MYHSALGGLSKGAGNFFLRYVKLAGGPSPAGGGEVCSTKFKDLGVDPPESRIVQDNDILS